MRIAVFSNTFPVLSETFVINQIVGLIKLGVKVDIITDELMNSGVMHQSVEKYGLLERVKRIGLPSKKNKVEQVLLTVSNALKLVLRGKYSQLINVLFDPCLARAKKINLIYALSHNDGQAVNYTNIICHFGNNGYYVCKLRELGLISGPVSTIFHGQEMSRRKTVNENIDAYKKLFVYGDLMLPISELWRCKLIEWGCKPSKIKVHRMGIDLNDFKLKVTQSPLSSPLKVIQVGRLTEKKAILDAIKAVVLASQKIAIDFTIIGDGELFNAAEQLIVSSQASNYIHLLGRQPQDVVKDKLNESDVFLLPSVTAQDGDMEGIPVALMEAMAKGLITLSTYHSGIPELIENNVSGFLVDESQVNQIANSLIKINALSVHDLENLQVNARLKCREEFNNETLNQKLMKYY
ncbi:glycosyltransferase [Psychromonas sp. PT13]|uniref:glycosyltransferase n=1 Tax=Psychromonas sp. PT13 TaxID=3439547 RepID=UPI003EBD9D7F